MKGKFSVILGLLSILNSVHSYTCDPNTCKPPSCTCASPSPPGGIDPKDAPQFIILSYDDAVNGSTFDILKHMYKDLAHVNGCPVVATHFVQNVYTNYHQVQQLHAQGDEIALHTFGHTELASQKEIESGKKAIIAFAGIPENDIKGFRPPFLSYNENLIQAVQNLGLTYDSSAPTIRENASWPYTLDNGFFDDVDCNTNKICNEPNIHKGLWEIPLYSTFYPDNKPPVSMDQDYDNGNLLNILKDNFNNRYNGNRQPMAIAVHAVHCEEPKEKVDLYREFIKWALGKKDVYFVTYSQLIEYMKNPVKASDLQDHPAISCKKMTTYPVNSDTEICDGIDNNGDGNIDEGVVENCNFNTASFSTCFGCPATEPTIENPVPSRNGDRNIIPSEGCKEGTWNPVTNECDSMENSNYLETITPEKVVTEENTENCCVGSGALSSYLPNSIFMITVFSLLINYIIDTF